MFEGCFVGLVGLCCCILLCDTICHNDSDLLGMYGSRIKILVTCIL